MALPRITWHFGREPRHERLTDRLPVHLAEETLGEIDLSETFRRD